MYVRGAKTKVLDYRLLDLSESIFDCWVGMHGLKAGFDIKVLECG